MHYVGNNYNQIRLVVFWIYVELLEQLYVGADFKYVEGNDTSLFLRRISKIFDLLFFWIYSRLSTIHLKSTYSDYFFMVLCLLQRKGFLIKTRSTLTVLLRQNLIKRDEN